MTRGKARVAVKVRAGARRTEFTGKFGESWKMQVAAPPVDGKANDAIIRFLADLIDRPRSAVRIVSGFTSSLKTIEVDGIEAAALHRAILEAHGT